MEQLASFDVSEDCLIIKTDRTNDASIRGKRDISN